MTPISVAVGEILANPVPVVFLDTCILLDLFRWDSSRRRPLVPAEEIRAAIDLVEQLSFFPRSVHLILPELVPGEFAEHADRIQREFQKGIETYDGNQSWGAEAALCLGITLLAPTPISPLGLPAEFRRLADELMARSVHLARDNASLNRAVSRLIGKKVPSHKNQIKDSMNMEQALELCSQLKQGGFSGQSTFVSSNAKDYADDSNPARIHPEIESDFVSGNLIYFSSLRAAVWSMKG